jgi:iron complex outermembrane receptor protein
MPCRCPCPGEVDEAASSAWAPEAIIVSARHRVESAQSVPAALSVASADTLTNPYSVNTNQLLQLVPTLNWSSPNPRNTAKCNERPVRR